MYDWLIVGLGNPGSRYEKNRHNIGWMVAEKLVAKHKSNLKASIIYNFAEMNIKRSKLLICMPTTFMNASGEAVRKLADKYSIPHDRIIVIVDEYNFPVGKIHIKRGGSDGGHNGISSIIDELNSDNFVRLRCGIGKDFQAGGMADYVLTDFAKEQTELVNDMINKSIESIEYIVCNDFARGMSFINSGKLWKKVEKVENKEIKEID